ncbi:IS110 family transposase [Candidatus Uhrbacteria bacterium]|nr:IS110 family transposase [Candidatus Uhrbacteria bacterium]
MTNRSQTLFVGVDVHKDTHTAVGVSPFGEKLFELTVGNYEKDFTLLSERAQQAASDTGLSVRFCLEDCHGYGERLASFLVDAGNSVCHVPAILVDHARKREVHPEKNDSKDAHGVAQVMIQRIDTLPSYSITKETETAKNIREVSMDREYLVKERTRVKNQLHTLLYRIFNTEYAKLFKDPFSLKALTYWMKSRPKNISPFLLRTMKRKVKRLLDIREEVSELEDELKDLITESGHTLQTASGCGTVLAGELIGEIGDVARFKTPAQLAKYAGCAPREHSSGKTVRWRKTRGGNRRLNRAFHRMALSQISRMGNVNARDYFKKKISEGKSKSQSLVCLRRHMVTLVWNMMKHKDQYRFPTEI